MSIEPRRVHVSRRVYTHTLGDVMRKRRYWNISPRGANEAQAVGQRGTDRQPTRVRLRHTELIANRYCECIGTVAIRYSLIRGGAYFFNAHRSVQFTADFKQRLMGKVQRSV